MAFKFAEMIRGFSAGGNKVEAAIALVESLFSAAEAVYDVVVASKAEETDKALARLDEELARVAPLASGLRTVIAAQFEAAEQALKDKFGSNQP